MSKLYEVEVVVKETHYLEIEADSVEEAKLLAEGAAPDEDKPFNTDVEVKQVTDISIVRHPLFKGIVDEYPDQVDPADEDHIYFNADPGEKPK
tara:strand:- start:185 stop:463 length:279 start_codon:yes stop_codon:yes gene_type:complete